jgi:hypothetical protein
VRLLSEDGSLSAGEIQIDLSELFRQGPSGPV